MQLKDEFPHNIEFLYIPLDLLQDDLTCLRPIKLALDRVLEKPTLLVSIPGSFSPLCTEQHVPDILQNLHQLKTKLGIENVVIYSVNDSFVLNAWGKLLVKKYNVDLKSINLFFASDANGEFSMTYGLGSDRSKFGMGYRSDRFAMVIRNRVIEYFERDTAGVSGSSASGVLAKL